MPASRAIAWTIRAFGFAVACTTCGGHSASAGYYRESSESQQASGDQWQNAHSQGQVAESSVSKSGRDSEERPSAAPAPQAASRPDGMRVMAKSSRQASESGGFAREKSAPSTPLYKAPPPRQQQAPEPKQKLAEPMVVYLGYLHLRVKRQLEAVDAITRLAQQHGGYVETLSGRVIVVRVPAHDFDGVLAAFASVGEVLDRRIKALDVSRQFTDTRGRLEIARNARERLLHLLKSVSNVEERLQILEEVKRLTEQIETAESVLATLRNLADFFTITIELEPVVVQTAGTTHRSPFEWIRRLSPYSVTLEKGKKHITLLAPRGFVQFEDDDLWRAQAADTSMLRAALVQNEPRGDAAFWSRAIAHEMQGRDFEAVQDKVLGLAHVRMWRNKDVRPSYYVVAVMPAGDDVCVVEAFLPNETAWQTHRAALEQALVGLQVAP